MDGDPLRSTLAELIALRAAAQHLVFSSRRSSRHLQSGGLHTPFRGRGMEYAESRPYAVGDDARHVDWRVTARSGQLHSKLFHPERDRVSAVVVDAGASMQFATRGVLKSVQAARLAALFTWHAAAQGDRLSVISLPHSVAAMRPTAGERGALAVLQALVGWQRVVQRDSGVTNTEGLATALQRLERNLRSGAHILLLLDAASINEPALKRLRGYVRRHDVLACVVVDPIEIEMLPSGRYPVTYPGSDQPLDAMHLQPGLIERSAQAVQQLRQAGARACYVRTDEDAAAALAALLAGRRG